MTDQLSGGLPFAPQPKSYGQQAGDYLHKARLWMDDHTPGLGTAMNLVGLKGSAMGPANIGAGGILNDPAYAQRALARMKAEGPFGGNANSPQALFGPPTYPGTQTPLPSVFGPMGPAAPAPEAPQGPAELPPPQMVGAGRIGMPMGPQVSDGGYNALDAAANQPPVMAATDSRANFIPSLPPRSPIDLQGMPQPDGSYNGLPQYERPYTPPPREETNGPDLIKKFMSYLNDKR